jgi:hypothetical protein
MTMRLTLRKRKSPLQRVLDTVGDSLGAVSDVRPSMPTLGSDTARKAGLVAAASAIGLTAGSAGISSVRRRATSSKRGSSR